MFKKYQRKQIAELRPVAQSDIEQHAKTGSVSGGQEPFPVEVSISQADLDAGSPKIGDMIARNPKNHQDQWLVARDYFEENFAPMQTVVWFKLTELAAPEKVVLNFSASREYIDEYFERNAGGVFHWWLEEEQSGVCRFTGTPQDEWGKGDLNPWAMEVDGRKIPFKGNANAEYLSGVYRALGYKVVWAREFKLKG